MIAEGLIQPIPDARAQRWWVSASLGWRRAAQGGAGRGVCVLMGKRGPLSSLSLPMLLLLLLQSLLHPRWRQLVCRTGPPLPSPEASSSSSGGGGGGGSSSSSSSRGAGLPDARGEVWGVPYRFGSTLVAYHRTKLLR